MFDLLSGSGAARVWMARENMMRSVIELAKNGNVVVGAEYAGAVVAMAQSAGIIAFGGALIEREDGGCDKGLYTEQDAPAWIAMVEELTRSKWVGVALEDVEKFASVCRALGIAVCGGAIVERDGMILQGLYIE